MRVADMGYAGQIYSLSIVVAQLCEDALAELVDRLKTDGTMTNVLATSPPGSSAAPNPGASTTLAPIGATLFSRPVRARRQVAGAPS
jgi:hypothetical protein